jgi:hypothetical protein
MFFVVVRVYIYIQREILTLRQKFSLWVASGEIAKAEDVADRKLFDLYKKQGDTQGAIALHRELVALSAKKFKKLQSPAWHKVWCQRLVNLAKALWIGGEYDCAIQVVCRSLCCGCYSSLLLWLFVVVCCSYLLYILSFEIRLVIFQELQQAERQETKIFDALIAYPDAHLDEWEDPDFWEAVKWQNYRYAENILYICTWLASMFLTRRRALELVQTYLHCQQVLKELNQSGDSLSDMSSNA